MSTKIILKKSSVPGKVPQPSQLEYGELALNFTDGVLHYKNASNEVKQLNTTISASIQHGDSTNSKISPVSEFVFDSSSGFQLTDELNGKVRVSLQPHVKQIGVENETLVIDADGKVTFVSEGNAQLRIEDSSIVVSINQGPDSGLDADTLDGFHASEFKTTSAVVERYEFDTPSLQWVISHNRNTTRFVATTVDSIGNQFFAGIKTIDDTTFVVNMTTAMAGYVDVVFND